MFSFTRQFKRRLTAVIALLAIMMLFIAPEVSTTLEQQRLHDHADHEMQYSPLMSVPLAQRASSDAQPHHSAACGMMSEAGPAGTAHNSPGGMMDNVFCGYCQLLVHVPLLLFLFIPFVWLITQREIRPPVVVQTILHSIFFPGISQPRAPPIH